MKYALTVKQSLLFTDLSLLGGSKDYFKKALNINYAFTEAVIQGDDLFWNYDNDLLYNKALIDSRTLNKSINHFIQSLAKATKTLESTASKIVREKKWQNADKSILKVLFDKYTDSYLLNMPFLFHFWNTENILIRQLTNDFLTFFEKENADELLRQVLIPSRETYFVREKDSFEQIAIYINNLPALKTLFLENDTEKVTGKLQHFSKISKMIQKHITEYAFITTFCHLGNPLTVDTIIERLKIELKGNMAEKIGTKQILDKTDKVIIQNIIKQLRDLPEVYERVKIAQTLLFWRNQRLDILSQSDLLIKPLYEKIAALMGVSYGLFVYLTYGEITNWFHGQQIPSSEDLEQRMEEFSFYLKDGKISLLSNKSIYEYTQAIEKGPSMSPSQSYGDIKGTIAYKGKVIGKVRLIATLTDIKKIKKGEILVTTMTRPEMIIGLEKASAFVTDQGGMLSHAAIVSREMKKPCIVGTKNATRLLKNGNVIEVNANIGIVRILK